MKHVFQIGCGHATKDVFSTRSGQVPVNREQTLPTVAVTERAGARFSFSISPVDLLRESEDSAVVSWRSSVDERKGIDFLQKSLTRFVTPRIPRRKDPSERYRLLEEVNPFLKHSRITGHAELFLTRSGTFESGDPPLDVLLRTVDPAGDGDLKELLRVKRAHAGR